MVVFATSERITILDIKTIKGNIFELIDELMNFVIKNIRWKAIINGESQQRREIPEIPLVVLREVIINSFAHARCDVDDIYSNRISISNPGSFANDFTLNHFFQRFEIVFKKSINC